MKFFYQVVVSPFVTKIYSTADVRSSSLESEHEIVNHFLYAFESEPTCYSKLMVHRFVFPTKRYFRLFHKPKDNWFDFREVSFSSICPHFTPSARRKLEELVKEYNKKHGLSVEDLS